MCALALDALDVCPSPGCPGCALSHTPLGKHSMHASTLCAPQAAEPPASALPARPGTRCLQGRAWFRATGPPTQSRVQRSSGHREGMKPARLRSHKCGGVARLLAFGRFRASKGQGAGRCMRFSKLGRPHAVRQAWLCATLSKHGRACG